jgi:hypothetical protein
MWQDIVIFIVSLGFILALIPSVKSENKPDILTSFFTGLGLAILSITYLTLSLPLSSLISAMTASVWIYLAYQKYKLDTDCGC